MQITAASDSSVMVTFGDTISEVLRVQVSQLFAGLRAVNDPRIRNLHPAYASLLVDYDPLAISHDEVFDLIQQVMGAPAERRANETRCVEIPVCYDAELGPDLANVAKHAGVSVDEVARAHSAAKYVVGFLGFSPGFAYLEGLPHNLEMPRLAAPRQRVEAGSVGIAGRQTGVYPISSPGGWQIIGRTPVKMFEPKAQPPSLLQLGDEVRFKPVSREEFERAIGAVQERQPD